MPNNIKLFKSYISLLDEVYKQASLTSDLDGNNALAQETANAGEFLIPKMDMDGLADYDRKTGYVDGSVNLDFETKKANYDRARKFSVNAMDNQETAGVAFGALSAEFIRTKAVPELDAFRFATYAGKAGKSLSAGLADGAAWMKAVSDATTLMDNKEVSDNRILFINPAGLQMINDMDTTKSRATLGRFSAIRRVPQGRFTSAIKMFSGKGAEVKGGYEKDSTGKDLNFMIIDRAALIQYTKNLVTKVIDPMTNQNDDAWLFFYHMYGIAEVFDNKTDGIYVHTVA